jgi:transposase
MDVLVATVLPDLMRSSSGTTAPSAPPSIDLDPMIHMLIVDYCCGIRSERRLSRILS